MQPQEDRCGMWLHLGKWKLHTGTHFSPRDEPMNHGGDLPVKDLSCTPVQQNQSLGRGQSVL